MNSALRVLEKYKGKNLKDSCLALDIVSAVMDNIRMAVSDL